MADSTISAVVELLLSTLKEQIENEVQLVRGVDKELEDLSEELKMIRNVLDDADRKQFTDKTVKHWLWRLEQTSNQMEDVLEEWNYAILEHKFESESPNNQMVCSFIPSSCFCFKKLAVRHDIASKVQDLKSKLDKILNEKVRYNFDTTQPKSDHSPASSSWRVQSTSLIDLVQVQGRNDIRDDLVIKLRSSHEGSGYQILSIVGGGGLGKTTLAQLVYNHPSVKACFDFTIWICVSDPFNVAEIAIGIIKGIDKNSSPDATQLDALLNDLKGCISGKKILLVLDDVWNKEGDNLIRKWEPLENALKCAGASSKILVTTRNEKVAEIMGTTYGDIIRPELLSDEDCWLLLSRSAALSEKRETKRFEETGKGIAEKCKGLPLAAKTLGSLLRFKNTPEEWEEVLKSDMWGLEQVEVELFPHLLLSYHELSPTLKRCFSYCSIFPKDANLKVDNLIRMWMALGYLGSNMGSVKENMELKGREYFQDLAMRSLLQDFEEDGDNKGKIMSCKMHDIVHDFAQFVRKSPGMSMSACQVCNTNLISRVKEYRGLSWDERTPLNICDCLTSLRVLAVSSELNYSSQGMKKLIHLRCMDISFKRFSKEDLKIICKLYFLQTLLLTNCWLKEIPMEIGNLIHLRHLNLHRNNLKEIPGKIGNLVQLRHLDLSRNKELKELPESTCSLLELQTLLLERCSLKEIPNEIGNLVKLRHLDLSWNRELKELPESFCSLLELRTLLLVQSSLKEIPVEIGNLVKLRHLDLSWNAELKEFPESMCSLLELHTLLLVCCSLEEIPGKIENLVQLRHLDLSINSELKELPESLCSLPELQTLLLESCSLEEIPGKIGNLVQLRHLDLSSNTELKELPESLCSLLELQILDIEGCIHLYRLPEGISQLTGLHILSEFKGGSGRNKLGLLKNLNRLTESLTLEINNCSTISDLEELVEDAQQAELKNKICLQSLTLVFSSNNILRDEKEVRSSSSSSSLWVDVIEALEPNHNLQRLEIKFYEGSKLPLWISLSHNLLREIHLEDCRELSSLPPLGKLPFLESLSLKDLDELKLVCREWLGIRGRQGDVMKNDNNIPSSSSATNVVVAFPKLKFLRFERCKKWEEWEDITAGEEESAVVFIMPCLTSLHISDCKELKLLPHRLLRKAQSLKDLNIGESTKLIECYGDNQLVLPLGYQYP